MYFQNLAVGNYRSDGFWSPNDCMNFMNGVPSANIKLGPLHQSVLLPIALI